MDSRERIMEDLVGFKKPLIEIEKNLRGISWDYEGEAVVLKSCQVVDVLKKYIAGEIEADDVEGWANLIECREDIAFQDNKVGTINDVIYVLANPVLEGEISHEKCRKIIESLG